MSFAARLSSVRVLVGCVSVRNGVIEGEGVWRRGGLGNELRRSLQLCDRKGVDYKGVVINRALEN